MVEIMICIVCVPSRRPFPIMMAENSKQLWYAWIANLGTPRVNCCWDDTLPLPLLATYIFILSRSSKQALSSVRYRQDAC